MRSGDRESAADRNRRRNRDRYRKLSPTARLVYSSKQNARSKGIAHTISEADLTIPTHCPLLGIKLRKTASAGRPSDNTASVDRIDASRGYIPGNVWVISHKANQIKSNATIEEAEKLVRNWRSLA